jgi:HlyD family secretion protein
MKKRLRIAVVLLIALGAFSVWWLRQGSGGAATGLFSSGVVEATQADLGFQLPGRIVSIQAQEGDPVTEGQELAALDRTELEARRAGSMSQEAAARSRLAELERGARPQEIAQAEARLRTAEERVADADRDLERATVLHEGGAISQEALDKARTAREVAIAARDQVAEALELIRQGPRVEVVDAQRAMVEQARASVAQVEALMEQATIVAPFSGLVTVRHREPGEAVAAGLPVLTLRNLDDRWVRIFVREDAIGRVSIGQSAAIFSDSYPDREFRGVVTFISSEAEFTPRNVQTPEERTRLVYAVKVRVTEDPDFVLKPGVPADVRLLDGEGPTA